MLRMRSPDLDSSRRKTNDRLKWFGLARNLLAVFLKELLGTGCPTHLSFMPKVDLSNYQGREQAYVKHCLLERYLPDWAYKVGSTWDSLVYVDAFAGPWQTRHPNYADSSFGVAVDALRRCQMGFEMDADEIFTSNVFLSSRTKMLSRISKDLLGLRVVLTSLCTLCLANSQSKSPRSKA